MKNLRNDPLWDELKYKLTHPETEEEQRAREIKEKSYRESMLKRIFGDNEDGAITGAAAPILAGGITYNYNPYKAIQEDPTLSTSEKTERIREITNARNEQIESEHNKKMAKIAGGAALEIGSSFIPGLSGAKIANAGLKLSKPLIAQIAKKELTKGAVEGTLSGAISGLGRGMMENKNPIATAIQDATAGALGGAALGKAAGKIHSVNPRIKELDSVADKRQDWGIAYRKQSGKPEEAIEKLLEEQQGFVPNAFYKEGIGDVDLVWGKQDYQTGQGYGLKHIVDGRTRKNKIDGEEFVRGLPETFEGGVVTNSVEHPENLYIEDFNNKIAVPQDWNGKPRNWILTAHPQNKSASKRLAASAPQLSKPRSDGRSNNFTTELTADTNIIPEKRPILKSFSEWIEELRRNRRN